MVRVLHFVRKKEFRSYSVNGRRLTLEVNEHIFPPSSHGVFFAQNIRIQPGETVIDIGTGSGILAILAATLGGKVSATDTDKDAIETARRNAVRNQVKVSFSQGKYFAGFRKKFDVILANLPTEIIPSAYKKAIGRQLTRSIDGGKNGNQKILEFLRLAKKHMHKKSRICLVVYTVTDYFTTFKAITKNYNARLVALNIVPTKEFVEDNIGWHLKLNEKGKIKIFRQGKQWKAIEYVFELTLS